MERVRIVCVGKLKEPWQREACAEYHKRIGRYAALEILEVKDQSDDDPRAVDLEGERILAAIRPKELVIATAIRGKRMNSEGFSALLSRGWEDGRDMALLIGGSRGLSPAVYQRADAQVSFSDMTFPHGLMRVMLLEQLYRALTIRAGHPYHK